MGDLSKEVREHRAELDDMKLKMDGSDGCSTFAPSSGSNAEFVASNLEIKNWCEPKLTRTNGGTIVDITKFITDALKGSSQELATTPLCNGIRMQYSRMYAVTVNVPTEFRPCIETIASLMTGYAAANPREGGRSLFVTTQLPPVEAAKKDTFLATKAWVTRILTDNGKSREDIKAKWAPQWIIFYGNKPMAGLKVSGSSYITKELSKVVSISHDTLLEEFNLLMG